MQLIRLSAGRLRRRQAFQPAGYAADMTAVGRKGLLCLEGLLRCLGGRGNLAALAPVAAACGRVVFHGEQDTAMLDIGGKDDLRTCTAVLLEAADKYIKLLGIVEPNLDEHGVVAGHRVALDNIAAVGDKGIEGSLLLRLHGQVDEGLDGIPDSGPRDLGLISGENTLLLKAFDTGADSRGGKGYLAGDNLHRRTRILLQDIDDATVNVIHFFTSSITFNLVLSAGRFLNAMMGTTDQTDRHDTDRAIDMMSIAPSGENVIRKMEI